VKVKSYYVRVKYTDTEGEHPVGSKIEMPYESDADVAVAASMVAYGMLSESIPDDPDTPYFDGRDGSGQFASEEAKAKKATAR
jgi:hypothetical protein